VPGDEYWKKIKIQLYNSRIYYFFEQFERPSMKVFEKAKNYNLLRDQLPTKEEWERSKLHNNLSVDEFVEKLLKRDKEADNLDMLLRKHIVEGYDAIERNEESELVKEVYKFYYIELEPESIGDEGFYKSIGVKERAI